MIALIKYFLRPRRKAPIRFRWPQETVIIPGSPFEKIDAEYDAGDRLVRLIIYTRTPATGQFRRPLPLGFVPRA